MRNITYKYNVGDTVELKQVHWIPCTLPNGILTYLTTVKITERRDYNGPCYKFEGVEGFFQEACIAGLAHEAKNDLYDDEAAEIDTLQGPETKCDTEDSGESESKWYRISFSAKLTADDLRAMKKCFFDAMNESMEIYDLDGLVIEEA